jgi:uncharacterized protein YkwD
MPNPRSARHRARRSPARHMRWAVPLVAVLAATGFYLNHGSDPRSGTAVGRSGATLCDSGQDAVASSSSPCPTQAPSRPAVQDGNGSTQKGVAPGATGSGRTGDHSTSGHPVASPSPSSPSSPTHSPTPSPPGSSSPPQGAAAQVLTLINQARVNAGLPPYLLSTGLDSVAVNHDLRMADGCGLSHQCKSEPGLGKRETLAGVHWTQAGENIAEGGPATTQAQITAWGLKLTHEMLNETAPNDGHRQIILSRSFRYIGLAVIRDSTGTVWMTQDFAN